MLERLRTYAEGFNEPWDEQLEMRLLYVKVPLAYIAGFVPVAFATFRMRNVTA